MKKKQATHELGWVHTEKYSMWPQGPAALTVRDRAVLDVVAWSPQLFLPWRGPGECWHSLWPTPIFPKSRPFKMGVVEEKHWATFPDNSRCIYTPKDIFLMLEKCRRCVLTMNLLNYINLFTAKNSKYGLTRTKCFLHINEKDLWVPHLSPSYVKFHSFVKALFKFYFFNWSIIASQCCISSCRTMAWISYV